MRKCLDCGKDISERYHTSKRCLECQRKRNSLHHSRTNKARGELHISKGLCRYCDDVIYKWKVCKKHYKYLKRSHPEPTKEFWAGLTKKKICKDIYKHDKEMKDDPEALTTEFMEDLLGVSCKKLKREKD